MCNDTSLINNKINDNDTTYECDNLVAYSVLSNQPNRENRRKENKKKYYNMHELNIGRISMSSKDKDFCQKEKKKNFNNFLKGKVR